jgi:hypothetical protein
MDLLQRIAKQWLQIAFPLAACSSSNRSIPLEPITSMCRRTGRAVLLSCLRDSPRVYRLNLRSALLLRLPQVIGDLHP